MTVHSAGVLALEGAMDQCSAMTLPFETGDPEWVAGLLDTMSAGDVDVAIEHLDDVLHLMRKAAKARRMLATVDPELLRAGLQLRAAERSAS